MSSYGAKPRTLADDLLITTSGSRALHIFQASFTATITHLIDLGGKLSAHGSKLYSTFATHRTWLASFIWPCIDQLIPV
eukprot:1706378-Karenia_brevis.AAC.1